MKRNILCVDPGVGGGVAWVDGTGRINTAPNPTPPAGASTKEFAIHQVQCIDTLIFHIKALDPEMDCYIENVAYRPSDTPKTAARLNFNYAVWLTALNYAWGKPTLINPVSWQNQLGISVPSGAYNYTARKKCFQDFANERFADIEILQTSAVNANHLKHRVSHFTQKTADAGCMLWVYSEKDL